MDEENQHTMLEIKTMKRSGMASLRMDIDYRLPAGTIDETSPGRRGNTKKNAHIECGRNGLTSLIVIRIHCRIRSTIHQKLLSLLLFFFLGNMQIKVVLFPENVEKVHICLHMSFFFCTFAPDFNLRYCAHADNR